MNSNKINVIIRDKNYKIICDRIIKVEAVSKILRIVKKYEIKSK